MSQIRRTDSRWVVANCRQKELREWALQKLKLQSTATLIPINTHPSVPRIVLKDSSRVKTLTRRPQSRLFVAAKAQATLSSSRAAVLTGSRKSLPIPDVTVAKQATSAALYVPIQEAALRTNAENTTESLLCNEQGGAIANLLRTEQEEQKNRLRGPEIQQLVHQTVRPNDLERGADEEQSNASTVLGEENERRNLLGEVDALSTDNET